MKLCKRLVYGIAIVTYVFAVCSVLFGHLTREGAVLYPANRDFASQFLPNLFYMGIGAALFFGLIRLLDRRDKKSAWSMKKEMLICGIVLLVIQMIVFYGTFHDHGGDTNVLRQATEIFVCGDRDPFFTQSYFSQAPNQLFIWVVYILVYRLANLFSVDGNVLLSAGVVLLTNLSVILCEDVVYRLTGNRSKARISFLMAVFLYGISYWMSVPYTDMFSVFVPVLAFDIYIVVRRLNLPVLLKSIFICMIPLMFYQLKALNIILLIAIAMGEILCSSLKEWNWRHLIQIAAGFLICVIAMKTMMTGIQGYTNFQKDITVERDISWYFLLGSNAPNYGYYNTEDQTFTEELSKSGVSPSAESYKVVLERYKNMGITGIIRHWRNKSILFYGDGTFASWDREGLIDSSPHENALRTVLRNIFWPSAQYGINFFKDTDQEIWGSHETGFGKYYDYYASWQQFVWLGIFAWTGIMILKKNESKEVFVLKITWIGIFLFTMLFETNARLLLSYLPIFCVMAVMGIPKKFRVV